MLSFHICRVEMRSSQVHCLKTEVKFSSADLAHWLNYLISGLAVRVVRYEYLTLRL